MSPRIARSGLIRTTIVSYVFLLLGICLSSLSHCIVDHMLSRRDYFSIGLKNLPSNDGKCSEGISHLTPNWQRRQLNCWLTFNNIMLLQPLWLLFWKSVILGLLVGNSWNPGKKRIFYLMCLIKLRSNWVMFAVAGNFLRKNPGIIPDRIITINDGSFSGNFEDFLQCFWVLSCEKPFWWLFSGNFVPGRYFKNKSGEWTTLGHYILAFWLPTTLGILPRTMINRWAPHFCHIFQ